MFYLKKTLICYIRGMVRLNSRIKNLKMKKLGIFNYKSLSENLENYTFQIYTGNNTYGILKTLENYSYYRGISKVAIEHGFYTRDYVYFQELEYKKLITFSQQRVEIISKYRKDIAVAIGPYIHYAQNYYNNFELEKIKKNLGRTLLVFPNHSVECLNIQRTSYLEKKIEDIKKEFDSILICLYYADIQKGLHKYYENRGYTIVCAGHRYDINFLSRLKSIILLSDYTISNSFGTHTIYCTQLAKPHTIFEERFQYNVNTKFSKTKVAEVALKEVYWDDLILREQKEAINKYYSVYPNKNKIEEIKKELNYMFGFNEIKSQKEIYKILSSKEKNNE